MKFREHSKCIVNVESWKQVKPPKKGDLQWRDGRSAKELAKYMTNAFPIIPAEIENILQNFVSVNATFDWDAEYVTPLPKKGEGRNHDAILYNDDILVTVEAKADETLGKLIGEEMQKASINKLSRISMLLEYLFEDGFNQYHNLRYQLLTAAVGTILEAKRKNIDTAVMLVLVFKTNGDITEEKIASNHKDIENFFAATNAIDENGLKLIPNKANINLYFKEIIL